MADVLATRDTETGTDREENAMCRQRKDSPMTTEAALGVLPRQPQGHHRDSPSEPPGRNYSTDTLVLASWPQSCQIINAVILNHQFVVFSYGSPRKLIKHALNEYY